MGLQSQLSDVSTDSIPLLLIATIAGGVSHLRSIFLTLLHFLHLHRVPPTYDFIDHTALLLGSGLSNLVLLADQLNMNRIFSHKYGDSCHDAPASDCVVCLCALTEGDQVRRLPCRHVFHKSCFDGWLDHLNFNCPLCRAPLVETPCAADQRRLGADAVAWFGVR
uniref:RING-type domain-containing protein n=1 Tax=Kalanchoe fedtschenkoi TaxID=63787 RepID=A0A7N0U1R7_KALFE